MQALGLGYLNRCALCCHVFVALAKFVSAFHLLSF